MLLTNATATLARVTMARPRVPAVCQCRAGHLRARACRVSAATLTAIDADVVGVSFTVSGPGDCEFGRSNFSVPAHAASKLRALRVSRNHMAARLEGGALKVKDLDSRNGTFINGFRLKPGTWTPVSSGTVRMGDAEFLVSFSEAL